MDGSTLYDDDILLWSERQADVLRRLGDSRRDLPNELDLDNVVEEIESVGRSELAAVKSQIRLILLHLIKLAVEPGADAAPHWRGEMVAFHGQAADRYAPSMRQRIDMDELWRSARTQMLLSCVGDAHEAVAGLPETSPFAVDDMIAERIDGAALVARLTDPG